jgi:hypothetical protein
MRAAKRRTGRLHRRRRRRPSHGDDVVRPSPRAIANAVAIAFAFALVGGTTTGRRMTPSLIASYRSSFVASPSASAMCGGGRMWDRRASTTTAASSFFSSHLLVSSVGHSSGTAAPSGGEGRRRHEEEDVEESDNNSHRDDAPSRMLGDGSSPKPPTTHTSSTALIGRLDSFAHNIGKLRRARRDAIDRGTGRNDGKDARRRRRRRAGEGGEMDGRDDALIDACNSLVHFLRDESNALLRSRRRSMPPPHDDDDDDSVPPRGENVIDAMDDDDDDHDHGAIPPPFRHGSSSAEYALEMALVTSIRGSSELGDFVLIPKLLVAAVEYAIASENEYHIDVASRRDRIATTAGSARGPTRLSPRVFGEAFRGMSSTRASTSKLKSLWTYFANDVASSSSSILSRPPSSYELNAMLAALGDRGRVRAALAVYRGVVAASAAVDDDDDDKGGGSSGIGGGMVVRGDAYTASVLFGMLSDSLSQPSSSSSSVGSKERVPNNVVAAQAGALPSSVVENDDVGGDGRYVSPCWQWNEAMAILNTFNPDQMNNHAYAALLKVNERAVEANYNEVNATRTLRHNGVRCAMAVLERMKVNDSCTRLNCMVIFFFEIYVRFTFLDLTWNDFCTYTYRPITSHRT